MACLPDDINQNIINLLVTEYAQLRYGVWAGIDDAEQFSQLKDAMACLNIDGGTVDLVSGEVFICLFFCFVYRMLCLLYCNQQNECGHCMWSIGV